MKLKVAYLFTTFPKTSETFLQREVRSMQTLQVDLRLFSLWGGGDIFDGTPVHTFSKWKLLWIPLIALFWAIRKPLVVIRLLKLFFTKKLTTMENLGENLLGLAFGALYAHQFKQANITNIHAVWASMPAMAALTIHKLTGIPFLMGAHAYDIYEFGGDPFFKEKAQVAGFIHTSTNVSRARIEELGGPMNKVHTIRRGLNLTDEQKLLRANSIQLPVRFISIGRLVEKKGYLRQLEIYAALKKAGIPFYSEIIGEGPLQAQMIDRIEELHLTHEVSLTGWLGLKEVDAALKKADLFLFTGKIAQSGDRDGFPNVVGEAMAAGVPVIASTVSALPEVINHSQNGFLIEDYHNDAAWVSIIQDLINQPELYRYVAKNAHNWVVDEFDALKNAKKILNLFNSISDQ